MRIVGVLLVVTALSACESQSQDVANVRAAADAMEESGPFAVEMTIDLEMPEPVGVRNSDHPGDLWLRSSWPLSDYGNRLPLRPE
jgi:hypothetical protein